MNINNGIIWSDYMAENLCNKIKNLYILYKRGTCESVIIQ